jgi:hypothetical protein
MYWTPFPFPFALAFPPTTSAAQANNPTIPRFVCAYDYYCVLCILPHVLLSPVKFSEVPRDQPQQLLLLEYHEKQAQKKSLENSATFHPGKLLNHSQ